MKKDKEFSILYLIAVVSGLVSTICMAVSWLYWQRTLNTCVEMNCGCILYGKWTFSIFTGGDVTICRFVTLCPIPVILWSFVMCIYHVLRFFKPKKQKKVMNGGRVEYRRQHNKQWSLPVHIMSGVAAATFSVLIFSSSVLTTDGYYKTCNEYKKSVVSQLSANGDLAVMVLNRMSCSTVTDFMDYLQPDPSTLENKYRRTSKINTGVSIQIALIAMWVNFLTFSVLTVYIIWLYCGRRRKRGSKVPNAEAI